MKNDHTNYWLEALSSSFDELGIYKVWKSLTKEQQETIANDIEISRECMSMAFYTPSERYIDPEIERLKNRIKELEAERDTAINDFKKNIAMRRKCDIDDIRLEGDGHATIYN